MVMATLYYADEVRTTEDIPEFPVQAKVHPNEKKMALQLVEGMASAFDPAEFKDDYREALQKVITAKVEGEPVPTAEPKEEKVVDLMEALRRSLQATRKEEPARRTRRARPRATALRERHR
jgi:DNA end-binding protein Ku